MKINGFGVYWKYHKPQEIEQNILSVKLQSYLKNVYCPKKSNQVFSTREIQY